MESEKSGYISVTFSVAVILIAVYGYWPATLSIPWTYSGDALFTAITFQGMIDTGWILENPRLGMPFGHYFYDFPTVDLLHIFIIRGLTWAIPHWPICFNLFFMIGFFLTAWTTYWSSRQIGLKRYWALTTAILYTFLPYHYLRGQLHLFLTAYYTIPLVILLCLWIAMGKFSCASIKFRRSQVACFISLLMALSGIYYAFFSCFFVLVSGIVGFLKFRKRATLVVTILCISIICSGVFLQLIPNYWYYYHEGRNPTVAYRSSVESEHHGLKMIQLFMPVEGHRVRLLREFSDNYASSAPLVYENRVSSLGVLGSIGFILLLCCILLSNEKNKKCFSEKLFNIARLNLAAILLATIGGGGTLFALLVSPQIRAYNRISIFIALFSLWALFLVLQDAFHRYYNDKKMWKSIGFAFVLIIFGIFDQTPRIAAVPSKEIRADFLNDREFVKNIEKILPQGAMVFQLPYARFPEHTAVQSMGEYDLFRGYLHSKTLRWSYGAMYGRSADLWQKKVALLPLPEQLQHIAFAGFSGIYVDRAGFKDYGKVIEARLRENLGVAPLTSANGRLLFYDMHPYIKKLRTIYGPDEWQVISKQILQPVLVQWGKGFYELEQNQQMRWRWASNRAELTLQNLGPGPKAITIKCLLASGTTSMTNLYITGVGVNEQFRINSQGTPLTLTLQVPPGGVRLRFETDAPRIVAGPDLRKLYFRVINFEYITDQEVQVKEVAQ